MMDVKGPKRIFRWIITSVVVFAILYFVRTELLSSWSNVDVALLVVICQLGWIGRSLESCFLKLEAIVVLLSGIDERAAKMPLRRFLDRMRREQQIRPDLAEKMGTACEEIIFRDAVGKPE